MTNKSIALLKLHITNEIFYDSLFPIRLMCLDSYFYRKSILHKQKPSSQIGIKERLVDF